MEKLLDANRIAERETKLEKEYSEFIKRYYPERCNNKQELAQVHDD